MLSHQIEFRVRYAETDQMSFVYYGNYAAYFEMGRVELLRSVGTSYKALEESGILLPVRDYSIRYIKPAVYDDLLKLTTTLTEAPSMRIHFKYELHNQKNELLCTAETTLVFLDKAKNRPVMVPDALKNRMIEAANS